MRSEERKWLDDHGGVVRTEGPNENGATTYYAADGNYVTVLQDGTPRMRGYAPPAEGSAGATPSAPAPVASQAPRGSGMNQSEVEQWITQQGGTQRVQYQRSTRQVDNPAADPVTAKSAGVKFDPTAEAKITVSEEKWVAVDAEGKPTGAVLHVRRRPDNDFDIVEQAGANPAKPSDQTAAPPGGKPYIDDGPEAGKSGRRWGWNPATKAYDRDLGSSPAAQKADEGEESRQPVPTHPGYTQITTKKDGKTETYYLDPNGQRVNGLPQTPDQQVTVLTINGAKYTQIVKTPKDGSAPSISFLGPDSQPIARLPVEMKPGQVIKGGGANGEDVQAIPDPVTGVISYQPIKGAQPAGAGLKNIPKFVPDYTKPETGFGLTDYAAELRKKVGLPPEQGGITQKEYEDAVKEAHTTATTAVTTITAAANVEQQTLDARRKEVARRQNQASTDFTNAQSANKDIWKYTAPGQATLDQMALGSTAYNRIAQQGAGGLEDVPYPSLLNPWVEKARALLAGTAGGGDPRTELGRPGDPGYTAPVAPYDPAAAAQAAADRAAVAANEPGAQAAPGTGPYPPAPSVPGAPTAPTAPTVPSTAPGPTQPTMTVRNRRTGEVRQMTPAQLDAQADITDWDVQPATPAGTTPVDAAPGGRVLPPPPGTPRPGDNFDPPDSNGVQQAPTDGGWAHMAASWLGGGQPQQPAPQAMASPNPWGQQASAWMGGQLDPGRGAAALKAIGIPDDIIGRVLAGGMA